MPHFLTPTVLYDDDGNVIMDANNDPVNLDLDVQNIITDTIGGVPPAPPLRLRRRLQTRPIRRGPFQMDTAPPLAMQDMGPPSTLTRVKNLCPRKSHHSTRT